MLWNYRILFGRNQFGKVIFSIFFVNESFDVSFIFSLILVFILSFFFFFIIGITVATKHEK